MPALFGEVLSEHQAGASRFYLGDALGSVTEVVDAAEAVSNILRHQPWGEVIQATGSDVPSRRWVGKLGYQYHPEDDLELYYVRGRWYSPEVGRWLSQDPLAFLGSAHVRLPAALAELTAMLTPQDLRNLLMYAGNNPANRYDPSGQKWTDWIPIPEIPHLPTIPNFWDFLGLCAPLNMHEVFDITRPCYQVHWRELAWMTAEWLAACKQCCYDLRAKQMIPAVDPCLNRAEAGLTPWDPGGNLITPEQPPWWENIGW